MGSIDTLVSSDLGSLTLELRRAHIRITSQGKLSFQDSDDQQEQPPQRKSWQGAKTEEQAQTTYSTTSAAAQNEIESYDEHSAPLKEEELSPEDEATQWYRERFSKDSKIHDLSSNYASFVPDELELGPILGMGGFATVHQIRSIKLQAGLDSTNSFKTSSKRFSSSRRSLFTFKGVSRRWSSFSNKGESKIDWTAEKEEVDDDDDDDGKIDRTSGTASFTLDQSNLVSRRFMSKNCLFQPDVEALSSSRRRRKKKQGDGEARYALKQLREDVREDDEQCALGMVDMATEIRVMSSVPQHAHIVQLRATATCSPFHKDFFIVLDRLYDTLEQRIRFHWKKQRRKCNGWRKQFLDRTGNRRNQLWKERLVAMTDLASALAHLHRHGIIHRDLKPQNIGFDLNNDIKIFDFGLAKELPSSNRSEGVSGERVYNFTQMVGSPRYMAEEVAMGRPYNETCDTYSFALLLWQTLALKEPYLGKACSLEYLVEHVWKGPQRDRPAINPVWSPKLKGVMQRGWSSNWTARPSMKEIHIRLQEEIDLCLPDDTTSKPLTAEGNSARGRHLFSSKSTAATSNTSCGSARKKEDMPLNTAETLSLPFTPLISTPSPRSKKRVLVSTEKLGPLLESMETTTKTSSFRTSLGGRLSPTQHQEEQQDEESNTAILFV